MQKFARTKRRLIGSFSLIAMGLCLMLLATYRAAVEQKATEAWVTHTYEVMRILDQLWAHSYENSAGHHAYALARSEPAFDLAMEGRKAAETDLALLRTLTEDNPEEQRNLESLGEVMARRDAILDDATQALHAGGADAYGDSIRQAHLADVSRAMRETVARMKAVEAGLLAKRRKQRDHAIDKLNWLNLALVCGLVAGTGMLFYRINVEFRVRTLLQEALQAAAERTHERYRSLVEHALPDALFIHDGNGRILDANQRACENTGYGKAELERMTVFDIETEITPERAQALWRRIAPGTVVTEQGQHRRKDGSLYPVEVSFGLLEETPERTFVGIVRDISERRRIEREAFQARSALLHASRLTMIGEIASTISHEVNQPLGAIGNFLEAALTLAADQAPLRRVIEKAQAQAKRAAEVVRKVRAFATDRKLERQPCAVAPLIDEACSLARLGSLGDDVDLELYIAPNLPPVLADRVQIQQVILNLLRNAAEAMAGQSGKMLGIEAIAGPAGRVDIIVRDNGPGIAQSMRGRLFTSFATTKPDGTGLGLSTSRAIALAHDGKLALVATVKGAAFRLSLPAAEAI
jgi:two-component system sensor kinase FixL